MVKNKLAPPFCSAHTSLIYGKGIPMGVAVVDMAVDYEVIRRKGSYGQGEAGKEVVAQFLEKNPSVQEEDKEIMAEVAKGIGFQPLPSSPPPIRCVGYRSRAVCPLQSICWTVLWRPEEGILDLSDETTGSCRAMPSSHALLVFRCEIIKINLFPLRDPQYFSVDDGPLHEGKEMGRAVPGSMFNEIFIVLY